MKKIVIVYHSGVGVTKRVAEKIAAGLARHCYTNVYSVEKLPTDFNINDYDGLAIGFPVIHTHPTARILSFINSINRLPESKPAYLFTTCGWYSANTLRIFSKQCVKKNIIPVVHRVFWGCPATDGTLLAPFIKRFFLFPKSMDVNIEDDVNIFCKKVESQIVKLVMPKFKLYSILTYPNKLAGQLVTFPIYIHKNKCTKCDNCIANCPARALEKGPDGYAIFISKKCEKCYRCIHHCPSLALSLNKRKTPQKVLGNR